MGPVLGGAYPLGDSTGHCHRLEIKVAGTRVLSDKDAFPTEGQGGCRKRSSMAVDHPATPPPSVASENAKNEAFSKQNGTLPPDTVNAHGPHPRLRDVSFRSLMFP